MSSLKLSKVLKPPSNKIDKVRLKKLELFGTDNITEIIKKLTDPSYSKFNNQLTKFEIAKKHVSPVSQIEYHKTIAKGGEFVLTQDNDYIRIDIGSNTFDEASKLVSKIINLDINKINFDSKVLYQYIDQYELFYKGNSSSKFFNSENSSNYNIYSNDKLVAKIAWHPAGHLEMLNDKNSQRPHFNFTLLEGKGKSVSGHIYYKN